MDAAPDPTAPARGGPLLHYGAVSAILLGPPFLLLLIDWVSPEFLAVHKTGVELALFLGAAAGIVGLVAGWKLPKTHLWLFAWLVLFLVGSVFVPTANDLARMVARVPVPHGTLVGSHASGAGPLSCFDICPWSNARYSYQPGLGPGSTLASQTEQRLRDRGWTGCFGTEVTTHNEGNYSVRGCKGQDLYVTVTIPDAPDVTTLEVYLEWSPH